MANHFSFPNFTTPIPETLMEVLDNGISPRYKISLNGLVITKVKAGGLSMMLKTGLEVAQDYNVSNYRPPIPQKYLNLQDRTIVARPGIKPSPKYFLPGHSKEKVGKDPPPKCINHG